MLADFALGEFAKNGKRDTVVDSKIDELKKTSAYYKNLSESALREAAQEEVVAESCQRMLTESDAIERLAELYNKDSGLFHKVKSFIANFFNRVVQRYKHLTPQGYEAKLVDSIPDMAERMKVLFSDALVTAAENQRVAEVQKNTAKSGVYSTSIKFQNIGSYPYDMQTVIVEYLNSTDLNLIDFIFDARTETNKKRLEYMHYDIDNKISQDILSAAKDILGFDISEYKIIINGESVHHIDRRHGKNGKHDHSMKDEHDMARAKYIINNADLVKWAVDSSGKNVIDTQYRDKNNRPSKVLAFAKKINGTYFVTVASPESNKKTLHIKSMYISKKIEDTQEFDAYSPELTPEANLELPSNDSILEEAKKAIHLMKLLLKNSSENPSMH